MIVIVKLLGLSRLKYVLSELMELAMLLLGAV
jgi:hypothetical protein